MRPINLYACLAWSVLAGTLAALPAPPAEAQGPLHRYHPYLDMLPVPAGVGVNIHFYAGNENDLALLEESGLGIVRMDISWAGGETSPGVYDFSHYDRLVADMAARGIRILFILDYGNPLYDDGQAPHTDEGRAAYARFCSALATHFADKPILWELWNEPNIGFWKPEPNVADYLAWCKAVAPAIREADPDTCIIGPGTSGFPMEFLEACFEGGFLGLVNGVSVHPYRGSRQGPETARRDYARLAAMIHRYKSEQNIPRDIPLISGEWGYTTTDIPRELQGKFLPRQWLSNLAYGIPISIWYDWHDDGQDPVEREHNFGTVTWDYQPKPAFTAMKTLIAELKGYTPAGRLPMEKDSDFVAVFRKEFAYKLAIWTTETSSEFVLPEGLNAVRAVDHLGQPVETPADGMWRVADAPVYLTLSQDVPSWLGILPLEPPAVLPARAGKKRDVSIPFSVQCSAPNGLELLSEETDLPGIQGRWYPSGASLGLGALEQLVWQGTITRRDRAEVEVPVAITARGSDGYSHTFRMRVSVPIANALKSVLGWRHDGMFIELDSQSDVPLKGELRVIAGGESLPAVPVKLEGHQSLQIPFPGVSLSGGPQTVSAQLVDEHGDIVAEIPPTTYALVDAVDVPVGQDVREAYRLWDEGEEARGIALTGEIVDAPGETPPFPRAVRVNYAVQPGWCFWQWGPKGNPELPMPRPDKVMLWVHGPEFNDHMLCRVADASGQTFQTGGVSKTRDGWELVELSLERPAGHWGGADDGAVHPPLRWTSYYLQDPARKASTGTTCLTGVVAAWKPQPENE
ncbi:MAG: cellulase family glycosylhydrolase [Candidatus Hydrogenedentes bacterium]|nr:cellulase family glycosylhydrolase [Candidatus Hydrogenedentota bacterium]